MFSSRRSGRPKRLLREGSEGEAMGGQPKPLKDPFVVAKDQVGKLEAAQG